MRLERQESPEEGRLNENSPVGLPLRPQRARDNNEPAMIVRFEQRFEETPLPRGTEGGARPFNRTILRESSRRSYCDASCNGGILYALNIESFHRGIQAPRGGYRDGRNASLSNLPTSTSVRPAVDSAWIRAAFVSDIDARFSRAYRAYASREASKRRLAARCESANVSLSIHRSVPWTDGMLIKRKRADRKGWESMDTTRIPRKDSPRDRG